MKKIVRGMNYTEMVTSKGESETVQHWVLKKMRKPSRCGVWVDGEKVKGYDDMNGSDVKPGPIRLHSEGVKKMSRCDACPINVEVRRNIRCCETCTKEHPAYEKELKL